METTRPGLAELCGDEVHALHRTIEGWLAGTLPESRQAFARFSDALAADFVIVHPSGTTATRAGVIARLWRAHGAEGQRFRIGIRNLVCRLEAPPWCLLSYEEWHHGDVPTGRISTALFRQADRPLGLEWVHLHETWLPTGES